MKYATGVDVHSCALLVDIQESVILGVKGAIVYLKRAARVDNNHAAIRNSMTII